MELKGAALCYLGQRECYSCLLSAQNMPEKTFCTATLIHEGSVLMQILSYLTETVLSNNITRNRIVLSFKDSPIKPLRQRPMVDKHASFVI